MLLLLMPLRAKWSQDSQRKPVEVDKVKSTDPTFHSIQDISCIMFETSLAVDRSTGLAKLDHTGLEIVERSLYQALLLLVVGEKIVPQCMLKWYYQPCICN